MAVDSQPQQANGLKTVFDTIVAPKDAFAAIRMVPTWGWALAIAIVLSAIGSFLMIAPLQHAMAGSWPEMVAKSPRLAQMTPAQQQAQLAFIQKMYTFGWVITFFAIPVFVFIEAIIMLVFDKIGRGEGSFAKYFAASANIAVVAAGIGSLVAGLIATLRGADSFTSMQSVQNTVPTLGMLAQGAPAKLAAFFSAISPFSLWGAGLAIAALLIIGRTSKVAAWLAGIVLIVVPALLASFGAQ